MFGAELWRKFHRIGIWNNTTHFIVASTVAITNGQGILMLMIVF